MKVFWLNYLHGLIAILMFAWIGMLISYCDDQLDFGLISENISMENDIFTIAIN